ncbi:MAG TPA: MFS transporter [Casimicrobiaceae bacterium]|nr:MFS transporter [Casimicrobiaceae bacterium]
MIGDLVARTRRTFRALRHRNYRLFFTGQGLSLIGTWAQQVAMGWLTWRLTESAVLLGVVAFCANVGMLALGPFAGVMVDRVNRRNALLLTQSLLMLQAVTLTVITALGVVQVGHLIALALFLSVAQTFDVVLRQSSYVLFVDDRADLANAIALNSMMVNAARVVGPALAGLLLAVTSEAVCFGINALSFLAVLFALSRIRWPAHVRAHADAGWWPLFVEGARYALGFAPARALLALVALMSFTIVPYSSLMPIYAKVHFAGGPQTLGFLLAAAGSGALVAMVWLAGRGSVRGLGRVIASAALASGAALAAFSHLSVFWLALALMVPIGGGVTLAAASSNTILQTIVDDRLRGRVAGFYTLAFLGVAPLGHITAGVLAGAIGVQNAFLINGVACLVGGLAFLRLLPRLAVDIRPIYRRLGILPDE